ncbi:hypothetical protein K7T73_13140 [Bacillus badius]|uniref:hypothetical protein n=1 Tax=Bacillus badius TaxID=1455 RepID=UPI001CBF9394|nr:hypothetical protein [Bacillus badius]UAT29544.1 hypothetical protein K7T73_13140 [Bacillus badius]
MILIKPASELNKIANEGKERFEKEALESKEFKNILAKIEEAAIEGFKGWRQKVEADEDIRAYNAYIKALNDAGYKAELKTETCQSALGFTFNERYFVVKWEQ